MILDMARLKIYWLARDPDFAASFEIMGHFWRVASNGYF